MKIEGEVLVKFDVENKSLIKIFKNINGNSITELDEKAYDLFTIYLLGAEVEKYLMLDKMENVEGEVVVTYVEVETLEMAKKYTNKVNGFIKKFNEKYNENMMEVVLVSEV